MTTTPATITATSSPVLRRACTAARTVACGHCGAPAGQPCATSNGRDGYHLARFGRARTARRITASDMAAAIMAAGPVFTPASVIPGGRS